MRILVYTFCMKYNVCKEIIDRTFGALLVIFAFAVALPSLALSKGTCESKFNNQKLSIVQLQEILKQPRPLNLCGVNLHGLELQGLDFNAVNLTDADLSKTNFDNANFQNANLTRTYFRWSSLKKNKFTRSKSKRSSVARSKFTVC